MNSKLLTNLFLLMTMLFQASCSGKKFNLDFPILPNNATEENTESESVVPPSFEGRGYLTSVKLADGRVIALGGENNNSVLTFVDIFNPSSNSLVEKAQMNVGRSIFTATLLNNGKVLAAGGYSGDDWNPVNSAEIYDLATDQWTLTPPMNNARSYHTATLLNDGRVLVVGGYDENWDYLDTCEVYNPADNTWTLVDSLSSTRSTHTAHKLANGKVLILGGEGDDSSALNTVEVFDPDAGVGGAGEWESKESLTLGRVYHASEVLPSGEVIVVGGYDDSWNGLDSVEIYSPETDEWRDGASLPIAKTDLSLALLDNGKIAAVGGYDESSSSTTVDIYDPAGDTWSSVGNLNQGRYSFALRPISTNRLIAFGGYGENGYLDSVEIFTLSPGDWNYIANPKPTIESVLVPNNGIYLQGSLLRVTVTFSEPVKVTGSPRIAIDVGGATKYARVLSHNNSANVVFTYTVGVSETDADGIEISSMIDFNNGSILSISSGTPASKLFNAVATPGVVVNLVVPEVVSVLKPVDKHYYASYPLDFTLTFSEPVTVTGSPRVKFRYGPTQDAMWDDWATIITTGSSTTHTFRYHNGWTNTLFAVAFGTEVDLNGGSIVSTSTGEPIFRYFDSIDTSGITIGPRAARNDATQWNEILMADGRKFATGGGFFNGATWEDLKTTMIYDPDTDSWTAVADLNIERLVTNIVQMPDGKIMAIGGQQQEGPVYGLSSVEIYDPIADTWTFLAPLNTGRFSFASVLLADGRVMVSGGRDSALAWLSSVEIYDPDLETWTTVAPLANGTVSGHTMELLPNGTVRVSQGQAGSGLPSDSYPGEIYDPN